MIVWGVDWGSPDGDYTCIAKYENGVFIVIDVLKNGISIESKPKYTSLLLLNYWWGK